MAAELGNGGGGNVPRNAEGGLQGPNGRSVGPDQPGGVPLLASSTPPDGGVGSGLGDVQPMVSGPVFDEPASPERAGMQFVAGALRVPRDEPSDTEGPAGIPDLRFELTNNEDEDPQWKYVIGRSGAEFRYAMDQFNVEIETTDTDDISLASSFQAYVRGDSLFLELRDRWYPDVEIEDSSYVHPDIDATDLLKRSLNYFAEKGREVHEIEVWWGGPASADDLDYDSNAYHTYLDSLHLDDWDVTDEDRRQAVLGTRYYEVVAPLGFTEVKEVHSVLEPEAISNTFVKAILTKPQVEEAPAVHREPGPTLAEVAGVQVLPRDHGDIEVASSTDFFLENPPMQPKAEVGEYVESHGILIPRRFADINEALASGKPFVVRSEHPQDYAGVSGLFESYLISSDRREWARDKLGGSIPDRIEWRMRDYSPDTVLAQVLAQMPYIPQKTFEDNLVTLTYKRIDSFLELRGDSLASRRAIDFYGDISYSYWEYLDGINRTIVADNAVSGRYHIFSHGMDTRTGARKGRGYTLVQDGEVKLDMGENLDRAGADAQALVHMYDSVRGLDLFDGNHCPIVEVQSAGGENYFLQYHRARDTQATSHIIDREPEQGEIEAVFVRGATPPGGMDVSTTVYFGSYQDQLLPEEGAMEIGVNPGLTELNARQRRLQIVQAVSAGDVGLSTDGGHVATSQLFKPELSVAINRAGRDILLDQIERSKVDNLARVQLSVVSDGTRAFLKRTS